MSKPELLHWRTSLVHKLLQCRRLLFLVSHLSIQFRDGCLEPPVIKASLPAISLSTGILIGILPLTNNEKGVQKVDITQSAISMSRLPKPELPVPGGGVGVSRRSIHMPKS